MNSFFGAMLSFIHRSMRPLGYVCIPLYGLMAYIPFRRFLEAYFHVGYQLNSQASFYAAYDVSILLILYAVKVLWELAMVLYIPSDDYLKVTFTVFRLVDVSTSTYKWSDVILVKSSKLGVFITHREKAIFIPRFADNYDEIAERLKSPDVFKRRFYPGDIPKKSLVRTLNADFIQQIRLGAEAGLHSDCVDLVMNKLQVSHSDAIKLVDEVVGA